MFDKAIVSWFPLRVSYSSASRLMKLKELLAQEDGVVDTYVPMAYKTINFETVLAPVIDNLLFVRVDYEHLRKIKENRAIFEPLRYIMHPVLVDDVLRSEVLYVPDGQLKDFIRVTKEQNDNVIFLKNMDFACKPGTTVQITKGMFAGVKGVVKSIKKHLCVVLPIKDVMAVAIINVPKKDLIYLKDENNN